MSAKKRGIWVFGDYRNYFQNRVTLQLLSRAQELAKKIEGEVCAVVFGHEVDEYVGEYIAHGAEKIYLTKHPDLKHYSMEIYTFLMERLARRENPEIILIGATAFGREFAPRVAKRLGTGLTADCIGLDINEEGLLVQMAPSFGGNLVAEIVTPERRPQMATVRPGTFQEIPHNYVRTGEVVRTPMPEGTPAERVRLIRRPHNPMRLAISCIAPREISTNSSSGSPIFSHSRIVSRFTEAAKAFSFIRFVIDFTLTPAIFRSG